MSCRETASLPSPWDSSRLHKGATKLLGSLVRNTASIRRVENYPILPPAHSQFSLCFPAQQHVPLHSGHNIVLCPCCDPLRFLLTLLLWHPAAAAVATIDKARA